MPTLTFAFCTYNRADRLEKLVAAMRAQSSPVPFEILAVNNNSTDNTAEVLAKLAQLPGPTLRWVSESEQGIVPARNRAIKEALGSDTLVFIDDDELPLPGLLQAVSHAIHEEGADCVGGPIRIDFEPYGRPVWLNEELSGFLGEIDYGSSAFWVQDNITPVWSGNIAYRMEVLRVRPDLRFDSRYNRAGVGIGGGSDAIMFRDFLTGNYKIRYRPDMAILHLVDGWKLKRSYFLKLHYRAGVRAGRHELPNYSRTLFGIPPFLVIQCMRQSLKALGMFIACHTGALRQGMNAAHAIGSLIGYHARKAHDRNRTSIR